MAWLRVAEQLLALRLSVCHCGGIAAVSSIPFTRLSRGCRRTLATVSSVAGSSTPTHAAPQAAGAVTAAAHQHGARRPAPFTLPPLMASVMARAARESNTGDQLIGGEEVLLQGWVSTVRRQKRVAFANVRDGSYPRGVQVVADPALLAGVSTGACIQVRGHLVASPAAGQPFEVQAMAVQLLGACDGERYPLQKKDQR